MKITSVELWKMKLGRKYILTTSLGTALSSENILVRINTDEDISGWGEASPFSTITGDTQISCFETGRYLGKLLLGRDPTNIVTNVKFMREQIKTQSSIRSALEMAMWDILGKQANLPIYKLLGGSNRLLKTDITIGIESSIEKVTSLAEQYLKEGFDEFKMKTGRHGDIDFLHVKAVRETIGEENHLKIDSNQGWNYSMALKNASKMESLGLMYFEQPLPEWNLDDMVRLRKNIPIPICADESVFTEMDAFTICKMGAADFLNIKLGKSGGIHYGTMINDIAESHGAKCMIGCFGETRLGLTAAAHLVLARPNIVFLDLDSAFYYNEDPIIDGMEYDQKKLCNIHVSDKPGLGLDVKVEYLNKWDKTLIS